MTSSGGVLRLGRRGWGRGEGSWKGVEDGNERWEDGRVEEGEKEKKEGGGENDLEDRNEEKLEGKGRRNWLWGLERCKSE